MFKRALSITTLLLLFALAGNGWAASKIEVDTTKGWLSSLWVYGVDADGTVLYASNGGRTFKSLNRSTYAEVTSTAFTPTDGAITNIFATSTPGTLFVAYMDGATAGNTNSLWKSTDYGVNFTKVLTPGCNDTDDNGSCDGAQLPTVTVSDWGRGICETTNATYKYLAGEYNKTAAASRTDGSTNDEVVLWGSADGTTWSKVVAFNNDGSTHNVDHIHAVRWDGAYVYIAFGDTGDAAGIIRWDPAVGTWADNQNLSYYDGKDGFKVIYGSQAYRTVDILFKGNYVYWISDVPTGTSRGIFRANKDLTDVTTVSTAPQDVDYHEGWTGVVLSSGEILFATDVATGASSGYHYDLYASDASAGNWARVGRFGTKSGTVATYPNSIFEYNNKIYVGVPNGSGKGFGTAILYNAGTTYAEEWPVILSPVYWADTSGSGTGYAVDIPLALNTLMAGSRITYGSRVIVAAANTSLTVPVTLWNGNANGGETTAITVIEGQGKDSTILYQASGDSNNYFLTLPDSCGSVALKNMHIYSRKTAGTTDILYRASGTTGTIYLRGAKIGNKDYPIVNSSYNAIYATCPVDIDKSTIEDGANTPLIKDFASGSTTAKRSTFIGGNPVIDLNQAHTFAAYHCDFYDYTGAAIYTRTGTTTCPIIKNSIFYSTKSPTYSIQDVNSLFNWTDTQLDYNIYYNAGTLTNIDNSGGSHSVASDPLFKSSTDLNIKSGSPAINAGINICTGVDTPFVGCTGAGTGTYTDYAGKAIKGPPEVGAYEFSGGRSCWKIGGKFRCYSN